MKRSNLYKIYKINEKITETIRRNFGINTNLILPIILEKTNLYLLPVYKIQEAFDKDSIILFTDNEIIDYCVSFNTILKLNVNQFENLLCKNQNEISNISLSNFDIYTILLQIQNLFINKDYSWKIVKIPTFYKTIKNNLEVNLLN
ncbi:hypothetical protein [Mycoplasma buteonis]|uniref:hypothetical protein n=1 Tax=Mycoplasma buteonis TaxID=171280 RepID=UPI0005648BAF|nr:hypothetical protein [Mycoplasma buteonis]